MPDVWESHLDRTVGAVALGSHLLADLRRRERRRDRTSSAAAIPTPAPAPRVEGAEGTGRP